MARPGGNATGFTIFEYAIAAKWLELLKEVAPRVTRAAVLRDANVASGIGQFAAIQAVTPVGIELSTIDLRGANEVEQAIAAFARDPNGGLIVTASGFGSNHPELIATLAIRHNLPAIYPFRYSVHVGGLICYGPDHLDQYRRAAAYVDRILKGENPANLPVQAPIKYETAINLKTAKAIGVDSATDVARPRRRGDRVKRRAFITLLGGAALRGRWPRARSSEIDSVALETDWPVGGRAAASMIARHDALRSIRGGDHAKHRSTRATEYRAVCSTVSKFMRLPTK